jgi:hypothetical protein
MGSIAWWCKNFFITILSLFFLLFGIEILTGAFYLENPLEFISVFFAASFIILISLVGIIYSAFQFYAFFRMKRMGNNI